jgi:hypothetical protein
VRWCGDYGVYSKTPSDLPPLLLKRDDQNCLLANKALQGFAQAYRSMEGDSYSFFAMELRIGNAGTHSLAARIPDAWRLKKRFLVTRPGWRLFSAVPAGLQGLKKLRKNGTEREDHTLSG